jgi:putative flippase GtrA
MNKFEQFLTKIFFFLKPELVVQLWRFSLGGAGATGLDFAAYLLLTKVFDINFLLANFISMTLGAIFLYIVNKKYTFKDNDPRVARQFAIFWLNAVAMFLITEAVLYVGVMRLDLWDVIVKIVAYGVVYFINFFFQKAFIFTRKQEIKKARNQ